MEQEQKVVKLSVEKNEPVGAIDKKQLDNQLAELTKKLDDFEKELDKKEYLIEGGKKIAETIKEFIENNAKWKFTEAIGVLEIIKKIDIFLSGKEKEFMCGPLELEAIYYFLSKHEGVGVKGAQDFYDLLKTINQPKGRKDSDAKKYEMLRTEIEYVKNQLEIQKQKENGNE
jgi:predicted RND superfamily exporter protein